MTKKSSYKNKILTSVVCAITLSAALFTAYSFKFHFDFTDEGMSLYLLNQYKEGVFLSLYFKLFHFWGDLLSPTVLSYRYLTFFSILCSSTLLSLSIYRFVWGKLRTHASIVFTGLIVLGSFCFYLTTSTFSYNTAATIAAYLWVSGMLFTTDGTKRVSYLGCLITSLSLLIGFTARPPFGVGLIVSTFVLVIFYIATKRISKKSALLFFMLSLGLFGIFFLYQLELIEKLFYIYKMHLMSSHQNVLKLNLTNIFDATKNYYLLVVAAAMHFAFSSRGNNFRLITLSLVTSTLLFSVIPIISNLLIGRHIISAIKLSGLLLTIDTILLVKFYFKKQSKYLFVTVLCLIASLGCGFGTNGSVMLNSAMSLSLLLAPVYLSFFDLTKQLEAKQWMSFLLILSISGYIWGITKSSLYSNYYRGGTFSQQKYTTTLPNLSGVFVEKEFGLVAEKLHTTLQQINFDFDNDHVIAYADIPGLVGALGLKSFGNGWMTTEYTNVDKINCAYIVSGISKKTEENNLVYLLLTQEFTPEMNTCFSNYYTQGDNYSKKHIGSMHQYRNGSEISVTLEGPFLLNSQK